jgi:hypothetical protein
MPAEFVLLDYPPQCERPSRVLCKPAGKRRYSAWLGNEFLGHAIARVDGLWTSKTPRDETFPGCLDRQAALLSLLALHGPVGDSPFESFAAGPAPSPAAPQPAWQSGEPAR